MAFDGNGNYQLPSPEFPYIPGTMITAEAMNVVLLDMAQALSRTLQKDGVTSPTATINWNLQKIASLGAGSADGDAVNFGQVFKNPTFTGAKLSASPDFADNSLLIPTTEWVRSLAFSAALPGQTAGVAGRFLSTDGTTASWVNVDSRGVTYLAKGVSAAGPKVIDYLEGESQSMTITGATTISFTNFPANRTAALMLRLQNAGTFPPTFTGIVFIKPDGSETSNFADLGLSWQTNGRDRLVVISEPGATPWARLIR